MLVDPGGNGALPPVWIPPPPPAPSPPPVEPAPPPPQTSPYDPGDAPRGLPQAPSGPVGPIVAPHPQPAPPPAPLPSPPPSSPTTPAGDPIRALWLSGAIMPAGTWFAVSGDAAGVYLWDGALTHASTRQTASAHGVYPTASVATSTYLSAPFGPLYVWPALPPPPPAPPVAPPRALLPPLPDPATWKGGHVGQAVIADLIAQGYPVDVVAAWARAVNAIVETVNPLIPPPPDEPPIAPPTVDEIPDVPADVPLDAGDEPAQDRSLSGATASFWRMLAAYARFKYTEGNRRILSHWASSESTPLLINNPLAAHRETLRSKPWPENPRIQWYDDARSGAFATAQQLHNGAYADVLAALRKGNDAVGVYNAVHASTWHVGPPQAHYPADLYDYVFGAVSPPANEPPAQPQPGAPFKPARAADAWADVTWFLGHQWANGARRASSVAADLHKTMIGK